MSGNTKEDDIQQPAPVAQPVATLACVTASGMRVPVLLTGSGGAEADSRSGWSTYMLRDSFYHFSTLSFVSRAKVKSDSFCLVWYDLYNNHT